MKSELWLFQSKLLSDLTMDQSALFCGPSEPCSIHKKNRAHYGGEWRRTNQGEGIDHVIVELIRLQIFELSQGSQGDLVNSVNVWEEQLGIKICQIALTSFSSFSTKYESAFQLSNLKTRKFVKQRRWKWVNRFDEFFCESKLIISAGPKIR